MGGGFIETAISLSLLYLMISLLCTIVVELGASWLKIRSRWLEHALRSLLYVDDQAWSDLAAKPAAGLSSDKVAKLDALVGHFKKQRSLFDHFADHPLIGKRPDQPQQQTNRAYISGSFPSYLTATTFAQAVVDILTPGKASVSVDDIRDAAAALPDCNFRRSLESLLKVAGDNLDKLRNELEHWFDDMMERLSGVYKRYMQIITFGTGFILAIAFNVDSIRVTTELWTNEQLRGQIADSAPALLQSLKDYFPEPKSDGAASAPAGTAAPVSPAGDASPAAAPSAKPSVTAKDLLEACRSARGGTSGTTPADVPEILTTITECLEPFPVGWSGAEFAKVHGLSGGLSYLLLKLVGLLLTGLAVTLGAPFWFDLLSMFVRIRGTGKKPTGRTSVGS